MLLREAIATLIRRMACDFEPILPRLAGSDKPVEPKQAGVDGLQAGECSRRALKNFEFRGIETHLSRRFDRTHGNQDALRFDVTGGGRSSAISRKIRRTGPWHGDLGHLEGKMAPVADDLRADLDQLLLQAGQRPVFDRLGRRQRAQEVAEVIGQGMKL